MLQPFPTRIPESTASALGPSGPAFTEFLRSTPGPDGMCLSLDTLAERSPFTAEADPTELYVDITRIDSPYHQGHALAPKPNLHGTAETILFDGATSHTGAERAPRSTAALQNFFDTGGRKVSSGGMRVSSTTATVPANSGILGSTLLGASLWQASALAGSGTDTETDLRFATYDGCLEPLLAAAVSGALVDLGLPFYFLAGLASTGAGRAASRRAAAGPPSRITARATANVAASEEPTA